MQLVKGATKQKKRKHPVRNNDFKRDNDFKRLSFCSLIKCMTSNSMRMFCLYFSHHLERGAFRYVMALEFGGWEYGLV